MKVEKGTKELGQVIAENVTIVIKNLLLRSTWITKFWKTIFSETVSRIWMLKIRKLRSDFKIATKNLKLKEREIYRLENIVLGKHQKDLKIRILN